MIIMQENCSKWQYFDAYISWNKFSEPGIAKEKKEEISRGVRGYTPPENFES